MMTRRTLVSIAMILVLVLCCIAGQAGMESTDDGWISITVGDEKSEFSPEGIQLEIYLVATGNYGNWTMVDAFSDITVFTRSDGSASVDMTLGQIRQRIADRRIQPAAKGTSDKSGKVEFKNLPHGIYYTVMLDGPERLSMSPMLVAVPNRNGSIQVRAVAKYEYTTPTPSPTPAPKPTMTPFVTPVVTPGEETPTPAPPTKEPVATPSPTPDPARTPVPTHVPTQPPQDPEEETIPLDDYEAALGLWNIQTHVGVCYE